MSAADIRPEIAADFARLYKQAIVRLEAALDSETTFSVKCANPRCGRSNVIHGIPDLKALTTALQFLHDTGLGKPGQQKDSTPPPSVAPGADLEALTDAELAAIIAAG